MNKPLKVGDRVRVTENSPIHVGFEGIVDEVGYSVDVKFSCYENSEPMLAHWLTRIDPQPEPEAKPSEAPGLSAELTTLLLEPSVDAWKDFVTWCYRDGRKGAECVYEITTHYLAMRNERDAARAEVERQREYLASAERGREEAISNKRALVDMSAKEIERLRAESAQLKRLNDSYLKSWEEAGDRSLQFFAQLFLLTKAIGEYRYWFDTCTRTLADDWECHAGDASTALDAALSEPAIAEEATRIRNLESMLEQKLGEVDGLTGHVARLEARIRALEENNERIRGANVDLWRARDSKKAMLRALEEVAEAARDALKKDGWYGRLQTKLAALDAAVKA